MFCKKCGKQSNGNQKYCINCGNPIVVSQDKAIQPQPVKRPPMPKEPWTMGRIIKAIIITVFVGGLILLRVIFGATNSIDKAAVDKNNSALTAYDSGNSDQAITQFQQASHDAVSNNTKINSLKNLGYVYATEGKTDLALNTFKEALALTSTNSFDYYLISGRIALFENKPNSALLAYNQAYTMDSENFQINNALTLFYIDMEGVHPEYVDYKKALNYALKASQLDNSNLSKKNLALAYYFTENYTKTISILTSVDISKEPNYSYFLGLSYAANKDVVNAKYYLNQAIAGGVDVPQSVKDYINSN